MPVCTLTFDKNQTLIYNLYNLDFYVVGSITLELKVKFYFFMFFFKYSKLNIVRNSVLLQTCNKILLNRFNWEDKNLKLYFTTNPNGHLRFLIFFHDELLREL